MIHAALQHLAVPIQTLTEDPSNARTHTDKNLAAIKDSLEQFGQRSPVVANASNVVIVGNARLRAAQDLGWTEIAVLTVDDDEEKQIRYAIADNRTGELGEWDYRQLVDNMHTLGITDLPTFELNLDALPGWDVGDMGSLLRPCADFDALEGGNALTPSHTVDDADLSLTDDVDESDSGDVLIVDRYSVFPLDDVRQSAFDWFRAHGFPYRDVPKFIGMQDINRLRATGDDALLRSSAGYTLADTYHTHRYKAHGINMKSPEDGFRDDALLNRALRLALEQSRVPASYFGMLSIVSGVQSASNFRPGFALYLYRRYACAGGVVLDTSTGYGGRLLGFIASDCGRYIGIDPCVATHVANLRIVDDFAAGKDVELHNVPAEDFDARIIAGTVDFAFTSPPYFHKEVYSDASTQSRVRYATEDAWREGFLRPMLQLNYDALRDGGVLALNIADVKISGKAYPVATWAVEDAARVGFVLEDTLAFQNAVSNLHGDKDTPGAEPVFIFRKGRKGACSVGSNDMLSDPVEGSAVGAVVSVKVSSKCANLLFRGCDAAYITDVCKASCCQNSTAAAGCIISVHASEVARVTALGGVVKNGLLQPRDGEKRCPFKGEDYLCMLHDAEEKPFGCVASPFTLNKNGTLITRNRYTAFKCYRDDCEKKPAYKAFRASLDLIFGIDEADRICTHFDKGNGDILANMPKASFIIMQSNDAGKRARSDANEDAAPLSSVDDISLESNDEDEDLQLD